LTRSERDPLLRFARALARAGVLLGGVLVLGAAVLVAVDVLLRRFFNTSVGGADEISGYTLAIGSAWAFGATLLDRAHVRIDSLYTHFPRRVCLALDFLALIVFTAFMALVTWYAGAVLAETVAVGARSMSPLATPLVIPQTLWVLGLLSVVLIGVLLLLAAAAAVLRGQAAVARRLIGSRTVTEELEEEFQLDEPVRAKGGR
jgi:TRAP-type mannitol/chloroaromatic compound transport system permease small subunit